MISSPSRSLHLPLFALMLLAPATGVADSPAAPQPRVNADAQLMVEFTKRAEEYAALHNRLERSLPDRPDRPTPQQVDDRQRALARLISQARGRAKPGDVFTKESRA